MYNNGQTNPRIKSQPKHSTQINPLKTSSLAGIAALASFHLVGILTNSLVGFVYTSADGSAVRVAYVDYWGRRVDIEFDTGDVVPFSALPDDPRGIYVNVKRYSVQQSFKLSVKYGQVVDQDAFRRIFGHTSII